MSIIVPIFMAALIGIFLTVQTGVNMQLQQNWALAAAPAALASLSIGALTTLAYILITRTPIPPLPGQTSIWHWSRAGSMPAATRRCACTNRCRSSTGWIRHAIRTAGRFRA